MFTLEVMGAWLGASALLLGFLWLCDWRTSRRIRKLKIMDRVLWEQAGRQYLEGPDPKWKDYDFLKDC